MELGSGKIIKTPFVWFEDKVFGRMRITVKGENLRFEKSKPFVQNL